MTGDTFNMSGDFRGANINIKSTLTNVNQSIGALPDADQMAKQELQSLIAQLNDVLQQAAPDKAEQAEAVAMSAESLVEQAKQEQPNKTMLQLAGSALKQAAQTLVDVAPAVLPIASQIVDLVGKVRGL